MELSEEEKKAIEYLENRLDILHNNTQWTTEKSIKIVLNLVEKLQREIKHQRQQRKYWRDNFYEQQKEIEELKFNNHMVGKWNEYLDKDCISKNRIKEIINKYIDVEDHLIYKSQELYGEDLKNMILELLGEK